MKNLLKRFMDWQCRLVDGWIMPLLLPALMILLIGGCGVGLILGFYNTYENWGKPVLILNKDEWQCTATVEKSTITTGTGLSSDGKVVIVTEPSTKMECTQYQKLSIK